MNTKRKGDAVVVDTVSVRHGNDLGPAPGVVVRQRGWNQRLALVGKGRGSKSPGDKTTRL